MGFNIHTLSVTNRSTNLPGHAALAASFNLARFAETLLPLLDPNTERAVELANEAISAFTTRFQEHWLAGM